MLPLIAIVGRPNVGKSTLFNRLIGVKYAITSPIAGTTRDRIYHEVTFGTSRAIVVDTGGLEFGKKQNIEADIQLQARIGVEEADIIFFVIDGTEPLTASDYDVADFLRRSGKSIILIAHKCDNQKIKEFESDFWGLHLGEPIPVSSIHAMGLSLLGEATEKAIRKFKKTSASAAKKNKKITTYRERPDLDIQIAIVGKPNVGKSSIVNTLLGKPRVIVSEVPGTTIDTTDTPFFYDGSDYMLIDTAGIRRRSQVKSGVEKYSVLRSLRAISRSDISCLVIDYESGITKQDLLVAQYVDEAKKGLMVVVNKTDLMDDREADQRKFLDELGGKLHFIPWAPVIFTSAITKKNIWKIFDLAKNIMAERIKKVPLKDFKLFTQATIGAHPPSRSGQKLFITTGEQIGVNPPVFKFTCNKPEIVHFSYIRFLENEIRRKFGFYGTPITIEMDKGNL